MVFSIFDIVELKHWNFVTSVEMKSNPSSKEVSEREDIYDISSAFIALPVASAQLV